MARYINKKKFFNSSGKKDYLLNRTFNYIVSKPVKVKRIANPWVSIVENRKLLRTLNYAIDSVKRFVPFISGNI